MGMYVGAEGGPYASAWVDGRNTMSVEFAPDESCDCEGIELVVGDGSGVTDATPPVLGHTVSPSPNADGWTNTDTKIDWSITEPDGPVTSSRVLVDGVEVPGRECRADDPYMQYAETPSSGVVVTCEVTSAGGTASDPVTLKVDESRPVVQMLGITPGLAYATHPTPSCATSDALSGVLDEATLSGPNDLGGGQFQFVCGVAQDRAFNESDPVVVNYTYDPPTTFDFDGFYQPVDPAPTVNKVKAGAAVPVRFRLDGASGLDIFATGFPRSSQGCVGSTGSDQVEQTVSAGQSGLHYDSVTGIYTYAWKTDPTWRGQCRRLELRFTDGSVAHAYFSLTR
jgi:hypothetical protein